MEIVNLAIQPESIREQAAVLLVEHFDEPYGWPSLSAAVQEVARVNTEGFARAMLDTGLVLGWVGGLPEYDGRVWELHPIVVRREHRRRGIGRTLVEAFEFHLFLFYQKLGFIVTGVMPDANGPGCPDIYMSKRITR